MLICLYDLKPGDLANNGTEGSFLVPSQTHAETAEEFLIVYNPDISRLKINLESAIYWTNIPYTVTSLSKPH
jgi:hypothetical protein